MFLDPVGNARDLPVAIANEDAGTAVGGRNLNLGKRLVDMSVCGAWQSIR